MVLGGRALHIAGLSDLVWGHVSARDSDGRGAWIKATGLGFDEATVDDIVLSGSDGEALDGRGQPPIEWPIHLQVLKARPDVESVVHVHPRHAIALAASARELQAFSHTGGVFARRVRRHEGAEGLIDTISKGDALAAALRDDSAVFLTGHGVVTVGSSVARAVITAVLLERACELQLLAEGFGGPTRAPDENDALRLYAHTQSNAHLLGAWDYLARQVQRTEAPSSKRTTSPRL